MSHLNDHDLILHYYGETEDPAPVERHLDTCPSCRAAYGALERVLNVVNVLPVPERGTAYESDTWRRVKPRLPGRARFAFWPNAKLRWSAAGVAMASLLVGAFLLGRVTVPSREGPVASHVGNPDLAAEARFRDRVLRSAVADYLDRTGVVLVELANATPDGSIDISREQERAADLLTESRLYQQTALGAGDHMVAGVLDELERVLLEIAHAPSRLEPAQLEGLRLRLRSDGILFRIRVLGATVRDQDAHKL